MASRCRSAWYWAQPGLVGEMARLLTVKSGRGVGFRGWGSEGEFRVPCSEFRVDGPEPVWVPGTAGLARPAAVRGAGGGALGEFPGEAGSAVGRLSAMFCAFCVGVVFSFVAAKEFETWQQVELS